MRRALAQYAPERRVCRPRERQHLASGDAGQVLDAFDPIVGALVANAGNVLALHGGARVEQVHRLDDVELRARRARRHANVVEHFARQLAHPRRHHCRCVAARRRQAGGHEHDRRGLLADAERVEITHQRLECAPALARQAGSVLHRRRAPDDLGQRDPETRMVIGERHLDPAVGHRYQRHAIARAQALEKEVRGLAQRGFTSRGEGVVGDHECERAASLGAGVRAERRGQRFDHGIVGLCGGLDEVQGANRTRASPDAQRDFLRFEIGHRRAVARDRREVHLQQFPPALGHLWPRLALLARGQLPTPNSQIPKEEGGGDGDRSGARGSRPERPSHAESITPSAPVRSSTSRVHHRRLRRLQRVLSANSPSLCSRTNSCRWCALRASRGAPFAATRVRR